MPRIHSLRQSGMLIGLSWVAATGFIRAEETAENKVARLRFTFEPQAHETSATTDKAAFTDGSPTEDVTADDVLHLRKMIVTSHGPKLIERELLTPKGRLDLAKKTYLTPAYEKTLGPLSQVAAYYFDFLAVFGGWHPNDAEAMALYEDAAQKRRNTEMNELISLASLGESERGQLRLAKPLDHPTAKAGILINGQSTP